MTVLIVTNEQDLGADYVVLELERRGISVLRCNTERLPSWDVCLEPGIAWTMRDDAGRVAESTRTAAVWWRRPEAPAFHELTQGERQCLAEQWQVFGEALATVRGPKWMSDPTSIARAEQKARQLVAARQVGLRIPHTIWTNDVQRARGFTEIRPSVVKAVTAAHWEDGHEASFVFTQAVTPDDLPVEASFRSAPIALQARVAGKVDIRVTVVGNHAVAAQATPSKSVDWRLDDSVGWAPTEIPAAIDEKCRDLVRRLGLEFAAIDLLRDGTGEYWFVELNPNGEWGWLEARGLRIASLIADGLADG